MRKIKIYILLMLLTFSAGIVMAQTDVNDKKSKRAERREQRKEEKEKRAEELMALINDRLFVLEAHSLYNRYSSRLNVTPSTNFISVNGDQLTIQTGNNHAIGYNGLGGITINGRITDYEVNRSKNDMTIIIRYSSAVMGHSALNLYVHRDGTGRALITDNWGTRVTFQGNIVSPENSIVFKGMAI